MFQKDRHNIVVKNTENTDTNTTKIQYQTK